MATQKGRNWSSGDIVTAANLSSVERGVSAMAEEYTPTTWSNGDTVTAVALNNIEQGIVSGGGGSSDFNTAEVTVTTTAAETILHLPSIDMGIEPCATTTYYIHSNDEPLTVTVILYKGLSHGYFSSGSAETVTGGVTANGTNLEITGNGTIAISNVTPK